MRVLVECSRRKIVVPVALSIEGCSVPTPRKGWWVPGAGTHRRAARGTERHDGSLARVTCQSPTQLSSQQPAIETPRSRFPVGADAVRGCRVEGWSECKQHGSLDAAWLEACKVPGVIKARDFDTLSPLGPFWGHSTPSADLASCLGHRQDSQQWPLIPGGWHSCDLARDRGKGGRIKPSLSKNRINDRIDDRVFLWRDVSSRPLRPLLGVTG